MRKKISFKKEHYLHNVTQKKLGELFDLKFVASEIQLNDLRFDNLAFDETNNSFVIIEYKNELNQNVLNQGREYFDLLLEKKTYYIERYNEKFETNLSEDDFDFDQTKVLIIAPEFTKTQIESSKNPDYPYELWKVTLYDDYCVEYENLSTGKTKEIGIDEDDLKITEDSLLNDKSPEMKELYANLKDMVLSRFGDVEIRYLVDQFSFRTNNKLICVVVFLKSSFTVYLFADELKNGDETDDIRDKSSGGNANYKLKIKSADDLEYFMEVFEETYNQKVK